MFKVGDHVIGRSGWTNKIIFRGVVVDLLPEWIDYPQNVDVRMTWVSDRLTFYMVGRVYSIADRTLELSLDTLLSEE